MTNCPGLPRTEWGRGVSQDARLSVLKPDHVRQTKKLVTLGVAQTPTWLWVSLSVYQPILTSVVRCLGNARGRLRSDTALKGAAIDQDIDSSNNNSVSCMSLSVTELGRGYSTDYSSQDGHFRRKPRWRRRQMVQESKASFPPPHLPLTPP